MEDRKGGRVDLKCHRLFRPQFRKVKTSVFVEIREASNPLTLNPREINACFSSSWFVSIPFKREVVSERNRRTFRRGRLYGVFRFPSNGKAQSDESIMTKKTDGTQVSIPFKREGTVRRSNSETKSMFYSNMDSRCNTLRISSKTASIFPFGNGICISP